MARSVVARWLKDNDDTLRLQERAADRGGVILAITKFWRLTLQMLIMAVGAWLVLQHELTGGAMMAGSILMGRALAPVEAAIGNWKVLVNARGAWRRLQGVPGPARAASQPDVAAARPRASSAPAISGTPIRRPTGRSCAGVTLRARSPARCWRSSAPRPPASRRWPAS